uniref:Uncharacterized protein n=1 Tax=Anopheles maculatus TaxID=74869 RepID=A0A182SZL7_9DIPT
MVHLRLTVSLPVMQLLGQGDGSTTSSRRSTSSIRGLGSELQPTGSGRSRSSREVEMRDVLETVRKQQLTSAAPSTSPTPHATDDDDRIVEDLLKDLHRSEGNNRPTEGSKAKNATLTGNTAELTEFERAVLSKYIRELQETEGGSSDVQRKAQADDQGDDSVRDNRLRNGGAQLDENANPLITGSGATIPNADHQHHDQPQSAQASGIHTAESEKANTKDETLPVAPSAHPQVVALVDANTLTSNGISTATTTTTAITTISNCILTAANNSNESCIDYPSKSDDNSARTMACDANAANDHNSVVTPSLCTTTTTNDGVEQAVVASQIDASTNASSSSASSAAATVVVVRTETGDSGGGNTTVAREAMAAIRNRAMRRNFSVWVGVTSCVWGLLLYLIKTYTGTTLECCSWSVD